MIAEEFVNGRKKQVFTKRGRTYTRKGYDLTVELAEKFHKKCQLLGETETRIVERMVEGFCETCGWGPEVKTAPMMPDSESHIKQAVDGVARRVFPWRFH